MSSYILDTDIVGFVQQAHPAVLRHLYALSPADTVATAIITIEEDIGGWLLRSAAQKQNAHPIPHSLDSSFRWNDENNMSVIPGEQGETRNPGFPVFPSTLSILRYGRLAMARFPDFSHTL